MSGPTAAEAAAGPPAGSRDRSRLECRGCASRRSASGSSSDAPAAAGNGPRSARPFIHPLLGTVRAFGQHADLLCPLLTSALRSGRLTTSSVPKDTVQISRSKPDSLHRTPAGFTVLVLDGYGLCDILPARPTEAASYPVSVRRVATLLHASFRQFLAVLPLRFASASPPSGCTGDFHPHNCRTCPTHRPLRAASGGGLRPAFTPPARATLAVLLSAPPDSPVRSNTAMLFPTPRSVAPDVPLGLGLLLPP